MATVLTLNGAFVLGDVMPLWMRGSVTFGSLVSPVSYNNFDITAAGIAGGVEALNTKINATAGVKVGFGHSEGARVIYGWLRKYGAASTVPPSDLSFVCTGNPERKYGGVPWVTRGLPDSLQYDVLDFTRQYDGWCDWPSAINPNRNALLNGLWGMLFGVHTNYFSVASGDAGNLTYSEVHTGGGGTVTYEYSPTKPLPIISTFWSTSTSGQDATQRPRVEAAYDRPVTIPPPTYL